MKYYKQFIGENDWEEITYEQALYTAFGSYLDNDITKEMLQREGEVPCMASVIKVKEEL